MNEEQWAVAITVLVAAIPWAFSVHAKLASIAECLKDVPQLWNRLEVQQTKLHEHEIRLARLSQYLMPDDD